MKFRLIRDDIEPSYPGGKIPDDMLDKVCVRQVFSSGKLRDVTFWRTDVVFDHPLGYRFVQNGDAVAEDDECREAANRTPEQLAAAQHARERLARGIHPEDWPAYEAGYMIGYDPDGEWIPGPNYAEYAAAEQAAEDEDEL